MSPASAQHMHASSRIGLNKRIATLQLAVSGDLGQSQLRLTIIYRGAGRITNLERVWDIAVVDWQFLRATSSQQVRPRIRARVPMWQYCGKQKRGQIAASSEIGLTRSFDTFRSQPT